MFLCLHYFSARYYTDFERRILSLSLMGVKGNHRLNNSGFFNMS